jgi:hypothetical protein
MSPSPHVVEPTVFVHAAPTVPEPLGKQSNDPVLSFTAHVVPAAHPNGFELQGGGGLELDDEHATAPTRVTGTNARRTERRMRMPHHYSIPATRARTR